MEKRLINVNKKGGYIVLKAKQKSCLEMMIFGDKTDKEIAQAINVTPKTICEWKKQKEFQEEYSSMVKTCLHYAASKAARTQINLLDSKSTVARHMAAKDILDRAGFKAEDKLNINGSTPVRIVDDLDE